MNKAAKIVVLCEDQRHEMFARRVLKRLGYSGRYDIFFKISDSGSAEQFVREQFATVLRSVRQRRSKAESWMLTVIDADNRSCADRISQFDDELASKGYDSRGADEQVAIWIPKWSVETWLLYLSSSDIASHVTEKTSYRNTKKRFDFNKAAKEFLSQYFDKQVRPSYLLGSLKLAYQETHRIDNRSQ